MNSKIRKSKWVAGWAPILLLAGLAVVAPAAAQKSQRKPPPPKQEDPFFKGAPFTLKDLLSLVPDIFEGRINEAIQKRGVSFFPTPADLNQLKQSGAKDSTLTLIQKAGMKFQPKEPPKLPTAGPLTLNCAPAECTIALDGKPEGATQGGTKRIANIPLGAQASIAVDYSKDGYIGQQEIISLKPGTAVAAKPVVLVPTEATREKFGAQVLLAVIGKLGGGSGLRDAGMLTEQGKASLYPEGGQQQDWHLVAKVKEVSGMAIFEIEGAGIKSSISLKGDEAKWRGKLTGTPTALEFEKVLRQYREYQPATLLAHIRDTKMKVTSNAPDIDPATGAKLEAGAGESYTLTIGSNGLPDKVAYHSASGLGSGLEVVYADWISVGQGRVPRKIDISFPGQHGVQLRFDQARNDPKLTDKDFKR